MDNVDKETSKNMCVSYFKQDMLFQAGYGVDNVDKKTSKNMCISFFMKFEAAPSRGYVVDNVEDKKTFSERSFLNYC